MPTKWAERWHRNMPLGLALLAILAPCALCAATLPGNRDNGIFGIGSVRIPVFDLIVIPEQPYFRLAGPETLRFAVLSVDGHHARIALCVVFGLIAAGLVAAFVVLHADHEVLFSCLTICVALTAMAVFVSVFARRHIEDEAGRTFLLVALLSIAALILISHDWARRQLVIATIVAAAVLSLFIVRIGFESLSIPPHWDRAQIAARVQADEAALELQHTRALPALLDTARAARSTLHDVLTTHPPPHVGHRLRTRADDILGYANTILGPGNEPVTKPDSADFASFDATLANEPVTNPPAATTGLADAVHALRTSEAAAAAQISHTALDQAICAVTGQQISRTPPKCTSGKDQITSNRAWTAAKHELDVQLAAYRATVTGTSADKAALTSVLAQQPDADADISALAAIENGPETLWRSAFHSTGPPLVPGPLGWVVLGALLLGLLGWLLKVNASQLAGPVDVLPGDTGNGGQGKPADVPPGDTGSGGQGNRLITVLRVAVLQNVAEPGAAPGAPSANPVTDLLDIAGGPLAAVSKIVQAALTVVGKRHGYQIRIDVTTDSPASSSTAPAAGAAAGTANTAARSPATDSTTVLVRITTISGGITLASRVFTSSDDEEAVRAAGLWAAGYILNQSSRIPSWAAWNAETAHALATTKNDVNLTIPALESALREAPNSGILLVQLGHQYELAGDPMPAITCYARAVTAHPRYPVARYRLAVALADMRYDTKWGTKSAAQRQDDLRAIEAAVRALKVDARSSLRGLRDGACSEFKNLAAALLRALETDTRYQYRLVAALRRSEREYTWPSLVPMSTTAAARFHPLVQSARLALGGPWELSMLSDEAQKPGSWWQISYNAACAYASRITQPDGPQNPGYAATALSFLEQTLVRPGVHQLSADWVKADTDLAGLKADPRFGNFLTQLRSGD